MRKPGTKRTPAEAPARKTTATLDLDSHQTRMVAFLAERLGGTTDDVLEFLVTAGLYVAQLDPMAEGRVADGLDRIYDGTDIATDVMNELRDIECNRKWQVEAFVASFTRPRVVGDWRGEPRPVQAEA